ncbi:MAG: CHASE3 domain-containing protein [Sphingobium sp.]|nr:CHASE3 domain-containing protein [Sphingobium sp.]
MVEEGPGRDEPLVDRRANARQAILAAVVFILLGVSVISAVWVSILQRDATDRVQHTLEVENRLNRLGRIITMAETGQRSFLLTQRLDDLVDYNRAVQTLPRELGNLDRATMDNAAQRQNVAQLAAAMQVKLDQLAQATRLATSGKRSEALQIVRSGQGSTSSKAISDIIGRMQAVEEGLLAKHRLVADARTNLGYGVLAISSLLVIVLAFIVRSINSRHISDLEERNRALSAVIAQRAQAESQVRQLQKMEAVGQLTGGIAHDFNNMLAIITGSLDLARLRLKRDDVGATLKCIDNAQEGAQRAASLTAQLLAFARSQPLEPRIIEPNRLVGSMSELLRRTLGERIEIETVLADGLWRVNADPAQIESALVNLAVNARDAMPDGGKLTIETANSELDDRYARTHEDVRPGQYVMLSVTDTGTGMPQDVIDRAFEPFFTTKDVGRGTGLGLSQVFGFVKQSNGHLKIYSELGKGTTVRVYLPRYVGDAASTELRERDESIMRAVDGEVILVAEDDAEVRAMTVGMLAELGYRVIETGSGAEALAMLEKGGEVTLLFTDIVMPGMTGRELAEKAIAIRPSLKLLYTTGYTRNSIVHNGMVDQGIAFIQKPFALFGLSRKLREVIDG